LSNIGDLAQEIFDHEFDSDTEVATVSSISGWLDSHIGNLNTMIHTSFDVVNGVIEPEADFKNEEKAIYRAMYLKNFNSSMSRKTLQGATKSSDFIQIRDSDGSMIVRPNKNTAAGAYRSLASGYDQELKELVSAYLSFESKPIQVAGNDAPSSQ
jgi:hypothetical protein